MATAVVAVEMAAVETVVEEGAETMGMPLISFLTLKILANCYHNSCTIFLWGFITVLVLLKCWL